jgi:hypothetical protein
MDQFKWESSPAAGWAYTFGPVQGVTMLAEGGLKQSLGRDHCWCASALAKIPTRELHSCTGTGATIKIERSYDFTLSRSAFGSDIAVA